MEKLMAKVKLDAETVDVGIAVSANPGDLLFVLNGVVVGVAVKQTTKATKARRVGLGGAPKRDHNMNTPKKKKEMVERRKKVLALVRAAKKIATSRICDSLGIPAEDAGARAVIAFTLTKMEREKLLRKTKDGFQNVWSVVS